MTEYTEELLRQRVWNWLETTKDIETGAEVDLGEGRIDLVGKQPDGEVWGIEVKKEGFDTEQVDRYAESGFLDRLFVASASKIDSHSTSITPDDPSGIDVRELSQIRDMLGTGISEGCYTRDEIRSAISSKIPKSYQNTSAGGKSVSRYVLPRTNTDYTNIAHPKSPISIQDAIRRIKRAVKFLELGIIHVPPVPIEREIQPGNSPEPEILRDAKQLNRTETLDFNNKCEEPWVRHRLWQEYGGIPEGHVPNDFDSDLPYRPIDLVVFNGSNDPTDAVENPEENDVIGIEAKGIGSFSKRSVIDQLAEFLDTETLSQLYLAIPKQIHDRALEMVKSNSDLSEVGILSVSTDGNIEKVRSATGMIPKYDGYVENHKERKIGYGDRFPSDAREVTSPYITDEEADRLKHSDSIEYVQDILPDLPWEPSGQDYPLEESSAVSLKERTELEADGSRIHVLEGTAANSWSMESGYVELLIKYFNREDCLLLNFGRNLGGYIWFSGNQIEELMSELSALAEWESVSFAGRGYVETSFREDYNRIESYLKQEDPDVEWIEQNLLPDMGVEAETLADVEIPPKAKNPRPSYADGVESDVLVEVISKIDSLNSVSPEQSIGVFQLGEEAEGVELEFTYAQWCDFIATVHILREKHGENRELPGKQTSSWTRTRIAPSGELVEDIDEIEYDSDVYR